jgi:hypothetical protein
MWSISGPGTGIELVKIDTNLQKADIFIKGLDPDKFGPTRMTKSLDRRLLLIEITILIATRLTSLSDKTVDRHPK